MKRNGFPEHYRSSNGNAAVSTDSKTLTRRPSTSAALPLERAALAALIEELRTINARQADLDAAADKADAVVNVARAAVEAAEKAIEAHTRWDYHPPLPGGLIPAPVQIEAAGDEHYHSRDGARAALTAALRARDVADTAYGQERSRGSALKAEIEAAALAVLRQSSEVAALITEVYVLQRAVVDRSTALQWLVGQKIVELGSYDHRSAINVTYNRACSITLARPQRVPCSGCCIVGWATTNRCAGHQEERI
jgi:hypothetical protein